MTNKCIGCDAEIANHVDYCHDCSEKEMSRIRGFLLIPAIGIIASVVILLFSTLQTFRMLIDHFAMLSGALKGLLFYEQAGFFLLSMLAVRTCFLFYGKRKALPRFYIALMLLTLLFHLADVLLARQLLGIKVNYENTHTLLQSFISTCIWMPYFLRSERVKKTFVR